MGKHLIDTRLVDYDIPESVWVMLLPENTHIVDEKSSASYSHWAAVAHQLQ